MAALDHAKVRELVNDLVFGRLFVHVGHDDDPSFHSCRVEKEASRVSESYSVVVIRLRIHSHLTARAPLSVVSTSVSKLPVFTPSDAAPFPRGSKPLPLRLTFGSKSVEKSVRSKGLPSDDYRGEDASNLAVVQVLTIVHVNIIHRIDSSCVLHLDLVFCHLLFGMCLFRMDVWAWLRLEVGPEESVEPEPSGSCLFCQKGQSGARVRDF